MGNPVSTTDYPGFSGATGKQSMLRELWATKGSMGNMQQLIFRIANTDFNALTDKSTIYTPDGVFASA